MFVKSESGARLTKILPKLLQTKDMDAVLKVSILNPFWGAAAMHPAVHSIVHPPCECTFLETMNFFNLFLLNYFPFYYFIIVF